MRSSSTSAASTSSRTRRRLGTASVGVLLLGMLAVPVAASASAATPTVDHAPAATGKAGPLTPRLKKLSDPAFRGKSHAAQSQDLAVAASGPGSLMERPGGRILVDVRVLDTKASTLARLSASGATIVYTDSALRIVTVEVAPSRLTALAAVQPQVLSAQEVLQPMVNATCPTGILSEGDAQLKADVGRSTHSVTGAGVTVGVLSDSYNRRGGAATDVTNGELPGTTNPCGFTTPVGLQSEGSGADEGRAMAQIVHDLAPAAGIRFASAFNGEQDFANQIRGLASAGAKVITDDVTYFDEPMYQDGVVGTAVEDVQAQGVTYFSSAGNENTRVNGQDVGSYETPSFRPMACPASVAALEGPGADCHNFNSNPAGTPDNTYGLTLNGTTQYVLGWNQPQFGITSDLDLFLVNTSTGAIAARSNANNLTTQKAYESFGGTARGSYSIVVARHLTPTMSTPRFKFVSWRSAITAAEYPASAGGDVVGPTTFGHNASRSGATVGAIPYNNANTMEVYSSTGPTSYCWAPVRGSAPATPLSPCESATVDLSATDGTANSFFGSLVSGVWRFFGTSAAAPHAAAVAALIRQERPCLAPAQVLAAMKSTAVNPGFETNRIGAGRVDADAALTAAEATPCDSTPPVVTVSMPAAPASGWFTTGPVVGTVTATDTPGGVASISCTGATVGALQRSGTFASTATASLTASGDGVHDIVCTAKDTVGNDGADPASANTATVQIDTAAPTAAPIAAPAPNAAGWNTTDVTVTWNWTDAAGGSGLDPLTCPATSTTTGEGTAVSVSTTCKDQAGNAGTTSTVTVKVDKTAPALAPSVSPNPVVLGGSATATPNATDATSGIDTQSCGPVVTTAIGSFTVTCTATDVAGNTATTTASYTVGAFFGSFISPLPKSTLAKATSSIPVKFTLRDANGPLSSTASAALAAAGQVQAVLSGPGTTGPVVVTAPCTWNTTDLFFQCTIKTPKTLTTNVAYYITARESGPGGSFFAVPGTGNPETVSFK